MQNLKIYAEIYDSSEVELDLKECSFCGREARFWLVLKTSLSGHRFNGFYYCGKCLVQDRTLIRFLKCECGEKIEWRDHFPVICPKCQKRFKYH